MAHKIFSCPEGNDVPKINISGSRLIFRFFLCSIFLVGFSAVNSFSQPDKDWKQKNDKGNRYEGQITENVSIAPIELLAFHCNHEDFTNKDNIKVRFYLHDTTNVTLTAREIINNEFYWMEAKKQKWNIGWNEFGPWPLAEVLAKLKVPASNLGVSVRMKKESGSGPIAPVILYQSKPSTKINRYTVYIIPGKSLSGGRYEIYSGCEGNNRIKSGLIGKQLASKPFPISFDLTNIQPGLLRLRIVVSPKNEVTSIPPSREFCFYHNIDVGAPK